MLLPVQVSATSQAPLAARLYRTLTRALPGSLGREYADEAAALFDELHAEEVRRRGALAGWLLWARSSGLLIACAVRARKDDDGSERRGGDGMIMGLLRDARFSLRALVKRPGFSLTAILILGTGIGATTTIQNVVAFTAAQDIFASATA